MESKSIQNRRPQTKKIFSQIPEKAAGKDKFGLKMKKSKLMKLSQINRPWPAVPQLALLVISTNLVKSSLSVFK